MKRLLIFGLLLFFSNTYAKSFIGLQLDGHLSTGRNQIDYELALKPSFHTNLNDDLELATQLILYHSIEKTDGIDYDTKTTQKGIGLNVGFYYQLYKLFSFKLSAGPEFPVHYYFIPERTIESASGSVHYKLNNYTKYDMGISFPLNIDLAVEKNLVVRLSVHVMKMSIEYQKDTNRSGYMFSSLITTDISPTLQVLFRF
ncbi:hypothetical protein JW960_17165 [candidate division KSB1 bacterium]|nr:hypothetical protein [candidate division KSB1 bacterium]